MRQRIVTALVLAMMALTGMAQRPCYEKMSPMLRQLVRNASGQRLAAPASISQPPKVCAFVKIEGNAEEVLSRHGCQLLLQRGTVCVAMIPADRLTALSREATVKRMEARPSGHTLMDSVRVQIKATAAHEALGPLPQAYTGRGVVMGVMDIGFDLTHPTFFNSDASQYRIRAFWDQLSQDTIGSMLPVGRDYTAEAELLALGHARDGLDQTHGTHTLGTAAGSGYNSSYRGIAPESDICIVANAVTDDIALIDSADIYKYTFATDALGFKYIFDQAERRGQPCVISFSEGSGQDFWGYDQLYYEMLDSLVGPGRIIVAAAGNEGRTRSWFRKPLGTEHKGTFVVMGKPSMMLTMKSAQPFEVRLVSYGEEQDTLVVDTRKVLASQDSVLSLQAVGNSLRDYGVVVTAYRSCYEPKETCYDVEIRGTEYIGLTPPLSVEVVGEKADVEVFRVNGAFIDNSLNPELNAGECVRNVHSPGSAPSVICVGGTIYRTGVTNYRGIWKSYEPGSGGARMTSSSVGPTYDGRIKPDVMAPAANVISSYSSFYLENHPEAGDLDWDVEHFEFRGRTYAWNCNSGTSMATPAVGGAIALWLQANPQLTPQDVMGIISRTSRRGDPTLSYPNNLWGYGEIDVYRGLLEVLHIDGISDIATKPSKASFATDRQGRVVIGFSQPLSSKGRVRLYDLKGRLLTENTLAPGTTNFVLSSLPSQRGNVVVVQLDGDDCMAGSQLLRLQ